MIPKRVLTQIVLLKLGFSFFSCNPDVSDVDFQNYRRPTLPEEESRYVEEALDPSIRRPVGLNLQDPKANAKATLGRVLFYDEKLSINNLVSCASCHKQQLGFADNTSFSPGFGGVLSLRNSMGLSNLWEQPRYFWDGRKSTLESMVLDPVKNHIEMGFDRMDYLVGKLKHFDYYPALFEKAFGDSDITEDRIANALAQFLRVLGSKNSPLDIFFRTNEKSVLTSLALQGFQVFRSSQCDVCHNIPGLSAPAHFPFVNIGLDKDDKDEGAGFGSFKTPSFRNLAFTAPYMHDGRFKTLEEVVEFYNSGVQPNPSLHPYLRDFGVTGSTSEIVPRKLGLTEFEKKALVAFLLSASDKSFTTDKALSNPFK
jgi:cytochrome c peroxidase